MMKNMKNVYAGLAVVLLASSVSVQAVAQEDIIDTYNLKSASWRSTSSMIYPGAYAVHTTLKTIGTPEWERTIVATITADSKKGDIAGVLVHLLEGYMDVAAYYLYLKMNKIKKENPNEDALVRHAFVFMNKHKGMLAEDLNSPAIMDIIGTLVNQARALQKEYAGR